jgi:biopolymer transport protein ExbD
MFGKRRKRANVDYVEPDLPITPMLDMSFQLLAFFIMTFQPTKMEGQILLALPKDEGGEAAVPNPTDDATVSYVVSVASNSAGTIQEMLLIQKGSVDTRPVNLGADPKRYFDELKRRADDLKGKPGKLILEIDGALLNDHVVRLIDAGIRAGFKDIAPTAKKK